MADNHSMNDAEMADTQESKLLKLAIPFDKEERKRFEKVAAEKCIIKGQFLRKLLLTWMDPSTGPSIESIMYGRSVPDLSAGQAKELTNIVEQLR